MSSPRPRPLVDLDSAPWWEGLRRHELLLQRCEACGRLRWPARPSCNDCASHEWVWTNASGLGTVASWSVTYHSKAAPTPFVVVLVRLDDQDDILMPGHMDGPQDGSELEMGMPVVVGYEEVPASDSGEPLTLLRWRRADGSAR